MRQNILRTLGATALMAMAGGGAVAHDGYHHGARNYLIGGDNLATIATGTYAGKANPNYNRLTFLYAHYVDTDATDHTHAIGTYALTGPGANPVIANQGSNYRLPEMSQRGTPTGQDFIPLLHGSGLFAGKFISGLDEGHYSNLGIYTLKGLEGTTDLNEQQLLASSGTPRRMADMSGAVFGLKLNAISAGLNVADKNGNAILTNPGDVYVIGSGNGLEFTPLFWTDGSTQVNTPLSASFTLVDLGTGAGYTPYGESGVWQYDFQVVPEPSSIAALGAGLVGLVGIVRRKR